MCNISCFLCISHLTFIILSNFYVNPVSLATVIIPPIYRWKTVLDKVICLISKWESWIYEYRTQALHNYAHCLATHINIKTFL